MIILAIEIALAIILVPIIIGLAVGLLMALPYILLVGAAFWGLIYYTAPTLVIIAIIVIIGLIMEKIDENKKNKQASSYEDYL